MNFEKYGGRRFLLTVAAHLMSSFLLWFAKIGSEAYVTLILATVAAYITSDHLQRNLEAKTKDTQ